MNDSTFINYDNYFATTSQMADTITPTQSSEFEDLQATVHYISNVPSNIAPLSQATSMEQRHQQTNLFNFVPNAHEETSQKHDEQCPANKVNSGSILNTVGSSGNVFGNIPFVQIHTTDVQPQRTSYGNVFRRNISKQDEIKAEPIKCENAESGKDRSNATPTPPRSTNPSQNENNMEANDTNEKQQTNNINNNEEKSCSILQIYKCSHCPFISLRDTDRDNHIASQHGDNIVTKHEERQLINCPGCSNVFFHQQSLKIHLKFDHLMRDEDTLKLINVFMETTTKTTKNTRSISETKNTSADIAACLEPIRKSRIYLKNVECLREPNRKPMEQTENQLTEINTNNSLELTKINPPKQKISIKSVDVLREPALLQRDYEMHSSNLNNFINFNNDLDLMRNTVNSNTNNTYDYSQNLDNSINKSNSDSTLVNSNNEEKPRRPKIYVKSVESFNLMPIESLSNNNNNRYLNDHNSSCNSSQVYDSNVVHLPYIYESSSTGSTLSSNTSFINNHNDIDTFQFINSSSTPTSNNYILESSLYFENREEINENCEQVANNTFTPETEVPTPPAITDINSITSKPLTTIQEQRGTLHLRTVDELNLMNKTEVQHLIAPNLDNNHNSEFLDKVNSSSLNDINIIGAELYEDDNFKFHDLDTQMVNNWPATYEDLDEDINCVIADASNENSAENLLYTADNNNQKINGNNFDIDTPQISLITIRDIEELTGTANHAAIHNISDHQQESVVEQIQNSQNLVPIEIEIVNQEYSIAQQTNHKTVSGNNLKRELLTVTPESDETSIESSKETSEMPPLVPVRNTKNVLSETDLHTGNVNTLCSNNIPLPPLVPVSSMVKLNNAVKKNTSPLEKGRIYVANNLMEPPKRPTAVSATSGTSVRGRPFGSNRTRITKLKQTIGSSAEELFLKCSIKGCAFRFKKSETVEYHRKCHDVTSDSPQSMLCPECKSTEFNNWNTLHTHLWRAHQIDMELYKCELCDFKTPIFSRLVNTHAKIHFEDRNYKCEQCEKAFKNSKQLKNHRRWHRVQAATSSDPNIPKTIPTEIYRCSDCGSTFSQQKTLREHCCKKGYSSLKCSICEKLMSSKSSLRLHLLTHSDGEKRHKCQNCDYATNDHNAFRRHRMGHENRKMYECNFCPYKSVQSVAYQKHILQKHPKNADSVIHKCSVCTYSTINRSLLIVHQAKHEKTSDDLDKAKTMHDIPSTNTTEKGTAKNASELRKSKIKVKSNLFTSNINGNGVNSNSNDVNLVQFFVDSGNVT